MRFILRTLMLALVLAAGQAHGQSGQKLSAARPTTSQELRSVITDPTGTGSLYFQGGNIGTPSGGSLANLGGLPLSTGITGFGTGIAASLAINVGSSGAPIRQDGVVTPGNLAVFSSDGRVQDPGLTPILDIGPNTVLGNFTSGAAAPGVTALPACSTALTYSSPNFGCATYGTGVLTALGITPGSAGAVVLFNGAGGTPSSISLPNGTGLPISTGVSGLGTGVATFLGTPSSANLLAALTTKSGTGSAVFTDSPSLNTPIVGSVAIASLPSAANAGQILRASNFGTKGNLLVADGSRWRPLNGEAVLATLDTQSSSIANSETLVFSYQVPAGLWTVGDRIRLYYGLIKSAGTDTGTIRIRIGSSSGCGGTALLSIGALSGSPRQIGQFFDMRLETTTSIIALPNSRLPGYGASTNTAYDAAATSLPNMTTTGGWINVCLLTDNASTTVALTHGEMTYLASAN